MPSNINQLVQTIVQLREMQDRHSAQQLAQQMAPYQQAAIQASTLAQLQGVAGGTNNPAALGQFSSQLGPKGLDPAVLQTIFGGTPTSTAATQSTAVAEGRNNPNASPLDKAAAQQTLTGEHDTPGSLFSDKMFGAAMTQIDSLPPDQQKQVIQGFLQKQATGQDLTSAAMDQVFASLTPAEQKLALKVKQGLALTAGEQAQLALGYTNARINDRQVTTQAAYQIAQAQNAAAEVAARYGAQTQASVNEVLFKLDALKQKLLTSSATETPEGKVTLNQQLNAYNEQLRRLAPEIYGPQGKLPLIDVPIGSTIGATGVGNAVGQALRNKMQ